MRTEDKYSNALFFKCVPAFISVGLSNFTWNLGTKAHKTLQIVSCSWEDWCLIGVCHSRGQYKSDCKKPSCIFLQETINSHSECGILSSDDGEYEKLLVFWNMTACCLVNGCQHIRGTCCLHFHSRKWRQNVPSEYHLCGLVVRVLVTDPDVGFDSRRYQIFLEAVGLERGPLSLVRLTEELLERKSSSSGLEN
jgi:hypothetical protein